MSNVDLHMHSAHSDDGQFTVLELIKLAEEAHLAFASITDHDSVAAARELFQYQNFTPVKWLSGVELSVRYEQTDLHLLAYGYDLNDVWFDQHTQRIKTSEEAATDERIAKINAHFKINLLKPELEKFAKGKLITGEIIAEAILHHPEFASHPELKAYFPKGNRSKAPLVNFYWDFLSQGKVAYVATNLTPYREAVEAIHKAGGVAVIAHPGQTIKENTKLLNALIHLGSDGIECYSSYHNDIQNAYYVEYAVKRKLLVTCGSDFHGKTKPQIKLGQTNSPMDAQDVIKQLENRGIKL